ncbi:SseB family protein [Acinetobacter lanii]|uniref:Enhanced serine sensitivity protein SseB n=1 Tax=Acinetobacter lanii TaxID=2715163 RepID=A0A6G8S290_9GAMM|nr:SseB family protein [Acinetobacter lanii]QIO08093.1 enhanced serine sensitivity protein SseB [Acinetobacter lanii]
MTTLNLEQLFYQTQQNYALIPHFLDQLLLSNVYCLGTEEQDQKRNFRVLETPEGDQAIPFFLELETVYRDFGAQVEHFTINTRILFEITQGATLVLNPTSELSKEFQPEEIRSILEMEKPFEQS